MIAKKILLLAVLLTGGCITSYAQYDDDIYYNPAKDKKTQVTPAKNSQSKQSYSGYYTGSQYNPNLGGADYAPADAYQVTGNSTRNVDEYNRRGAYSASDSLKSSATQTDDFKYTRRIEKYYNEDIIADVNDPALVEYYYSNQPDVTINIVSPGYGWYSPWYWNDPWYWNSWGPSWSWGWGPSWSWGWGPSWSWGWGYPGWGWGPSWSWGWGPSWGYPGWGSSWGGGVAWRPTDYTPNGRRPGQGVRNGYTGITHNSRPGLSNGNRVNGLPQGSAGNFRPGSSSSSNVGGRPANNNYQQSGSNYRPSGNQGTTGNRTTGNRNSYNNTNSNRNQNNSYYNNSNSNRSYSSPSRSSGSSRGGFSGGGSSGSHRGGRR